MHRGLGPSCAYIGTEFTLWIFYGFIMILGHKVTIIIDMTLEISFKFIENVKLQKK